jgi:hypothetical protein
LPTASPSASTASFVIEAVTTAPAAISIFTCAVVAIERSHSNQAPPWNHIRFIRLNKFLDRL